MPILNFELDPSGQPIIELMVSISSTESVTPPVGAILLPLVVNALVDTGASRSQVDLQKLSELNLVPTGEGDVYTASTGDSPESLDLFLVNLSFAGDQPGLLARNLSVFGSDRLTGLKVDMLLGKDVLDRCLLVYDGAGRRFTLAYNPPPPLDPD